MAAPANDEKANIFSAKCQNSAWLNVQPKRCSEPEISALLIT